eukprot:GHRR01027238.1.p1 GENE.GHRR01027238.1~~GHRR01027238.1.p1  ORF type:complete len:116 (+),score=25.23 GHRR01027238.1:849-1196(+)
MQALPLVGRHTGRQLVGQPGLGQRTPPNLLQHRQTTPISHAHWPCKQAPHKHSTTGSNVRHNTLTAGVLRVLSSAAAWHTSSFIALYDAGAPTWEGSTYTMPQRLTVAGDATAKS